MAALCNSVKLSIAAGILHHICQEKKEKDLQKKLNLKKQLKHRATEQLSKNKEEFGLKPEKVIHLFDYVCS
ncbi:MAG: hypothetical protein WCL71_10490 [Deltaproteobacteria bacterium]